jgi:cellulose synthase/poly-beta-1,6-N-acetylglucosamine synthase-like glycosyltransferase
MLDGEFVVIFDAEDRPEPLQLRKAVAQFRARPEIACLQAPLNYYNRPENMLTELFAIEYSALFRIQLPALEALDIPIPLGGTSNHIRSKILLDLGGWDAFNVTEDADLGIRLAYFGHKTAILDSITEEEAPLSLRAWLKQRSRWVKGYIQTWLVYSRDPRALKQRLSRSGYYGFQFFVGAPALTFIMAPFFWLACISALLGVWHEALPVGLVLLCNFSLLFGVFSHWHYARVTVRNEGWANMHRAIAIFPLYWLLHSLASFMALWQLLRKPFYWAKTTHGITRVST